MTASFLPNIFSSGYAVLSPDIRNLLRANTALSNLTVLHGNNFSVNTASLTYVNITNATMNFTKQLDSGLSDVLILVALSCQVNTASRLISVGVTDAVTTVDLAKLYFTATGEHDFMFGGGLFTTRNSGLIPFRLQMKNSGTGTFTMDSSDELSAIFWEALK